MGSSTSSKQRGRPQRALAQGHGCDARTGTEATAAKASSGSKLRSSNARSDGGVSIRSNAGSSGKATPDQARAQQTAEADIRARGRSLVCARCDTGTARGHTGAGQEQHAEGGTRPTSRARGSTATGARGHGAL